MEPKLLQYKKELLLNQKNLILEEKNQDHKQVKNQLESQENLLLQVTKLVVLLVPK